MSFSVKNSLKDQALAYHKNPPGKYACVPTKPMDHQNDLALAYSPHVAEACLAIAENPALADELTVWRTMVAVISNGTAVLGLGDIGPLAAKPVMEGKAVLFNKFACLNAINLEIAEKDPDAFVQAVKSICGFLGGINLEDIKAPECFEIEKKLQEAVPHVPIFHDDQHGTAIVTTAALLNALIVVKKDISSIKCVTSGAGAGALACLDLLVACGMRTENIFVFDSKGLLYEGRTDLNRYKQPYAVHAHDLSLEEAMKGADFFLGVSGKGAITSTMVQYMAPNPIIFALSNPYPEILPEEVHAVRQDALVGTGRSDFPNQINNVLCFPYIFRGALDVKATRITLAMKKACVAALQKLAQEGFVDIDGIYPEKHHVFGKDYFIPKIFDRRLLPTVASSVARAAIESGVAQAQGYDEKQYMGQLQHMAHDCPFLVTLLLRTSERILYIHHRSEVTEHVARALEHYGVARCVFRDEETTPPAGKHAVLAYTHNILPENEKIHVMTHSRGMVVLSTEPLIPGHDESHKVIEHVRRTYNPIYESMHHASYATVYHTGSMQSACMLEGLIARTYRIPRGVQCAHTGKDDYHATWHVALWALLKAEA